MKEKSLDEILQRNDYVKLIPVLKQRAGKLIDLFTDKMVDLDFRPVIIERDGKEIQFSLDFTEPEEIDNGRTFGVWVDDKFYIYDQNFPITYSNVCYANNKHYLLLLNNAKEIIKRIGEIEDELVAEAKTALSSASNI